MQISSDKRERIGVTEVSAGVINTYTFTQEAGQEVTDINIVSSKSGNKVAGTHYMGTSNRLLIDVTAYKYLTKDERKAIISTLLGDIDNILAENKTNEE